MFTSIRRYQTDSADDLTQQVNTGFLPLISTAPGFIAYFAVNAGKGVWSSVSIFETQANAEASNRIAADWVKKNLSHLGTPQITAGEVVAHKMLETAIG